MKAFGFISPSPSSLPMTAPRARLVRDSAASTSNGDTHMPLTLNMSSVRPQQW